MWCTLLVIEIRQTENDVRWFRGLPGDVRPVGEGISALPIDHVPGYRVFFVGRGETLIVFLAGGVRRRQDRDIKYAIELACQLPE